LELRRIVTVHELPHFVLITARSEREIAIPTAAFRSSLMARRFARELAQAAGIEPMLGFRSEWLGQRKPKGAGAGPVGLGILIGLVAVMLLILAVVAFR
jgi:hypothetical protein